MATLPLPIFLACLELGLQVNHHDLIPCFSCELAEMSHVSLQRREDLGQSRGRICSGQSGYHQEHQVPGAPPTPLTTSMYLFSGVEIQGTDRAKKQIMTLVSSCPVWFPWPFDHTALCPKTLSSFASSKVACELHQHLTVKPGGWNSTHDQSAGTQRHPAFSWVSVLFLQPDS